MITLKEKSKLKINWKVSPYDYSKEKVNSIITKASKKYNIPKDNISVVPNFIMLSEEGAEVSLTKDIVSNINDPLFQKKLFHEYIDINEIKNCNFELIDKIDNLINSKLETTNYDTNKKIILKWIKWDNFLSYGENNYFDFTKLNGLVLLHGEEPFQNQSGKTTFAIDLFHFLLFGKTSKSDVNAQIFNKFLPQATEVKVEGCVSIDNEDYVIKRTLSRPKLTSRTAKSKTSQKINYYKVINNVEEELSDYDDTESLNEESTTKTNKVIKEAIGSESDFDLMICATASNLDDLISMKETERGKIFSRWIGLASIEEKDIEARAYFNSNIKTKLLGNHFNKETLTNEIEFLEKSIEDKTSTIESSSKALETLNYELNILENNKADLLESKQVIDTNVLKIDAKTLKQKIDNIIFDGKNKRVELADIKEKINEIGEVEYDNGIYEAALELKNNLNVDIANLSNDYKHKKNRIHDLKNSEYCPTCKRKYDNVDNSGIILEIEKELEEISKLGTSKKEELLAVDKRILEIKELQQRYNEKNKLVVKSSAIELKIEQLTSEYKDNNALYKEYQKNSEAIIKNNELDIKIRNLDIDINYHRKKIDEANNTTIVLKKEIETAIKNIEDRKITIEKLNEEEINVRHWKIYLDMIGKNGISKMVLKRALPIINANVNSLLNEVCDFNISIEITDKNEVVFYIIKEGIKSLLSGGSGFELTCASLAIRSVLTKMSTLNKFNFLVLDEVLGRVASSNYDNMKLLYDKILNDYDFILQVTHIESVKDWHSTIIGVTKENNISKLKMQKNNTIK